MAGINLQKNQSINLKKGDGSALTRVRMGLGWDVAKSKGGFLSGLFGGGEDSIDLDASVIGFDASGNKVDVVYFGKLKGFSGAVQHTGDNRTGEGDGDDESIIVDLSLIPQNVHSLIFTVNSYTGQTFEKIANATCRLLDVSGGRETEVAKINLSASGNHTGVAMSALIRNADGGWSFKAISEICNGRAIGDIEHNLRGLLAAL